MLNKILQQKKKDIESMAVLDRERTRPVRNIVRSLRQRPFICEVKRKSPSKGSFPPIDPVSRAQSYEAGGAGAISVLTDGPFFGGSYDDLVMVSDSVSLPVLCKDFIVSEIQIENAYRSGADAVLLIAAALDGKILKNLAKEARNRNMAILFEIHDECELDLVSIVNPEMIGVNSRNLKTMDIDLTHAAAILSKAPANFMKVAESGLNKPQNVALVRSAGADAFLVGTYLMNTDDPCGVLKTLSSELSGEASCL